MVWATLVPPTAKEGLPDNDGMHNNRATAVIVATRPSRGGLVLW